MKYLIFAALGRQHLVKNKTWCDVDFIKTATKGDILSLGQILGYRSEKGMQIGTPLIINAKVVGYVTQHLRGKKLVVLKTKPKKNYTRVTGHRAKYTRLEFSCI